LYTLKAKTQLQLVVIFFSSLLTITSDTCPLAQVRIL